MSIRNKIFIIIGLIVFVFTSLLGILYFTVNPTIELEGDKIVEIKVNTVYEEKGAKSFVLGKDISDNVEIVGSVDTSKIGSYNIKYYISPFFLKKDNYVIRTINVIDDIFPEIELLGEKVNIYIGESYNEPGYKANDNYDGDITENVVVLNNIDNQKAGNYYVTYSIVDSSNNKTEVKREVVVKEKPVVKSSSSGYGIPVLMYHFFYDESKGETGKDSNWMEISDFEEQLKYLDENDYYFPTWSELVDFVDGKISLPRKSIIITIDDGDPSFFSKAIPVINKYDVKVTSFIITDRTPESYFSQYKSDKINFQSHTHDMHRGGCSGGHGGLFRCIDYDKGVDDLNTSIQIIGSSDAIAYPFGDCNDNVLSVTKNVGFRLGFTTKYGKVYKGMDKLQLPRVRMSKGVSLKGFINAIS